MAKNLVDSARVKVLQNGDDVSLDLVEEYYTKDEADTKLGAKVNVQTGKDLSTNDFSNDYKNKLNGIASGAQVNKIETIKVNGTALTPDSNKAVNIDISGKANASDVYSKTESDKRYVQDASYKHTDNNYTTAEKNKLSDIEEKAQVNVIEKIYVNGVEQTVRKKAVNIKVENSTKYTVRRKFANNTSSQWERMDDNVGKVANATKDGSSVENDFDSIYPWSNIKSYIYNRDTKTEVAEYGDLNYNPDGSLGDVLTRIPEFFWKRWRDDEYEYISISEYPLEGYFKSEQFSVGRYASSYVDSKISSMSGYVPEVLRNITWFRNESRKVGDDFGQMDYHYFLLQMLYLVEYADYNSQSKLGRGIVSLRTGDSDKALVAESSVNRIIINSSGANNYKIGQQASIGTSGAWNWNVAKNRTITKIEDYSSGDVTGKAVYFDGDAVNIAVGNALWSTGQKAGHCDELGMKSGCLANDGKSGIIYRGIENIFGNIWQFVDGINIKDYVAYLCTSPKDYKVDTFNEPYNALGFVNANANGFAKALGYYESFPIASFPTEVGASDSTGTCDYYYQNSGNRIALVGANWNINTYAGLWFWYMNNTSGSAYYNVGSRLLRLE